MRKLYYYFYNLPSLSGLLAVALPRTCILIPCVASLNSRGRGGGEVKESKSTSSLEIRVANLVRRWRPRLKFAKKLKQLKTTNVCRMAMKFSNHSWQSILFFFQFQFCGGKNQRFFFLNSLSWNLGDLDLCISIVFLPRKQNRDLILLFFISF